MKKTLFNSFWFRNAKNGALVWLMLMLIIFGGVSLQAQEHHYVVDNVFLDAGAFKYISTGDTVRLQGNITTVRDTAVAKRGMISFNGTADWTSTNNSFVDGYVRSHKTGKFIFPVGQGSYRPAAISKSAVAAPTDAAYYDAALYSTSALQNLLGVTDESWFIQGTTATTISLSWTSNISPFVDDLCKLCIAGWDTVIKRWVEIPSTVDLSSYIFGVASNLTTMGSVSTIAAIVPNDYAAYTLGRRIPQISIGTIATVTAPTCTTPGSISFVVTGGSGDYEYSIDGGVSYEPYTGTIGGLPAGYVNIKVQDLIYTCATAEADFTLSSSSQDFSIAVSHSKAEDCISATGALYVTVTGGNEPYAYILDGDGPFGLPFDRVIPDVKAGKHVITVTEGGGCSDSKDEWVDSKVSTLAIAHFTVTAEATCSSATGEIEFTVSGNATAYTYQVNKMDKVLVSDNDPIVVGGLIAGDHTLYIADSCGVVEYPFSIDNSDGSGLNLVATAQNILIHCDGTKGIGSIALFASGGDNSYEYSIDGGENWAPFAGGDRDVITPLTKGVYVVEVQDGSGCIFKVNNVDIDEVPDAPVAIGTIATVTDPDCSNPGIGIISLVVSGGSGNYDYSIDGGGSWMPFGGMIGGLSAGYVSIDVRDADFYCNTAHADFELSCNSQSFGIAVSSTPAEDCGSPTGTLYVTLNGGTAPYFYSFDGGTTLIPFPANGIIGGLVPDTYVITVFEGGGCSDSKQVGITAISSSVTTGIANFAVTKDATCEAATGEIVFTVTGNSLSYTYQVDNMGIVHSTSTGIITVGNLSAGVHMLYVVGECCAKDEHEFTIDNKNSDLYLDVTPVNIIVYCDGTTSAGSIALFASGGDNNYEYSIDGGANWDSFVYGDMITPLTKGIYVVEVRDGSGCIFKVNNVEINEVPDAPVAIGTIATVTEPTCTTTGSISFNISGGSGAYEYNLNDGAGWKLYTAGAAIGGLDAGYISIDVRDENHNCVTAHAGFTLSSSNQDFGITVSTDKASDCSSATGTIFVALEGGSAPYTYSLNGVAQGALPASGIIDNLKAGTYIVKVTDGGSCSDSKKAVISSDASTLLLSDFTVTSHATCEAATGAIAFTVSGNATPYTYQVDKMGKVLTSGNSVIIVGSLSAGEHTLYIADSCGSVERSFTIDNLNSDLDLNIAPHHIIVYCNGSRSTGSIALFASGGDGSYEYSIDGTTWTPFAHPNRDTITPLTQGIYVVEVRDGSGCTFKINNVDLNEVPDASVAIGTIFMVTKPDCSVPVSGTIHFDVSGGSGNYEYRINGNSGDPWITYTGANVTGLEAGFLTIEVRDANCPAVIAYAEFDLPSNQSFGIDLSTEKATDCSSFTGKIFVALEGGSAPYTYSLNGVDKGALPFDGVISGLQAGWYTVKVTSNGTCSDSKKAEVTSDASELAIGNFAVTSAATCAAATGAITFTVSGNAGPYTYQVDKMSKVLTSTHGAIIVGNLSAGWHTLYVVDNCGSIEYDFFIENSDSHDLNLQVTPAHITVYCNGTSGSGSIAMLASGGNGAYKYSIDGGATPWIPFGHTDRDTISPLNVGSYVVELRDDLGCIRVHNVEIKEVPDASVAIGTIATVTAPTCTTPGSISFNISGGSGAYEYNLNDGAGWKPYTAGAAIGGLGAGYISIDVRDENHNCATAHADFTLSSSSQEFSIEVSTTKATDCSSATGSIKVSLKGGSAPYTYTLDGAGPYPLPAGGVIGGLKVGTYVVKVTSNGTCSDSKSADIGSDASTLAVAHFAVTSEATCEAATGAIVFTVSGNATPYTYQVDQMAKILTSTNGAISVGNLTGGAHTLYVKDSCGSVEYPFDIPTKNGNNLNLVVTSENILINCNGTKDDGYIALLASSGTAPYQYSTDGGAHWNTFAHGDRDTIWVNAVSIYVVEVRDLTLCSVKVNNILVKETVDMCKLIDCTATPKTVMEDGCSVGYYTHLDGSWNIVPLSGVPFDSVKYFVNNILRSNGVTATLLNEKFNIGPSHLVECIAYLGTLTDTCRFMVTVGTYPVAGTGDITATDATVCAGTSALLRVVSALANPTFNWYDGNSATATLLGTGNTYLTSALNADTSFYVSVSNAAYCENPPANRVEVKVTVLSVPAAPTIVHNPLDAFRGMPIDLSLALDINPAYTYTYYANADGTGVITGSTITYNPPKDDYYVSANNGICESDLSPIILKDPCPATVDDEDLNTYKVTSLAGFCWTENLRATQYAGGGTIPFAKPYTCATCPAQLDTIFGLLYDWYSAVGAPEGSTAALSGKVQGICPDGWRIPTQAEWNLLNRYAADDLKSTQYWLNPLGPGTDTYGFDALPAGWYNGGLSIYQDMYGFAGWWACDAGAGTTASYFSFSYYCNNAQTDVTSRVDGLSVRCVLDY